MKIKTPVTVSEKLKRELKDLDILNKKAEKFNKEAGDVLFYQIDPMKKQSARTTTQALLDFMDSLPEPAPGEEPTDYASQVDHFI